MQLAVSSQRLCLAPFQQLLNVLCGPALQTPAVLIMPTIIFMIPTISEPILLFPAPDEAFTCRTSVASPGQSIKQANHGQCQPHVLHIAAAHCMLVSRSKLVVAVNDMQQTQKLMSPNPRPMTLHPCLTHVLPQQLYLPEPLDP